MGLFFGPRSFGPCNLSVLTLFLGWSTYWSIFAMFSSDKWHSYSLMLNKIFHFCIFFYISVLLKMIKRYPAKWSRIKGSPVHSRAKSDILNSLTLKNVKFWYRNRVLESCIHIVIRACHKQIINQIIGSTTSPSGRMFSNCR